MRQLLIAVCAWGIANFFLKLARASIPTQTVLVWELVGICGMALVAYALMRMHVSFHFSFPGSFWALLGGVSGIIGSYFFLEALGIIRLDIAAPFSSLHVLISALSGILFLQEKITLLEIFAVLAMVAGSILLGISEQQ